MRWIKHPSVFGRSAAMTDVREILGPAGYGATWLLLERIAESWDGVTEPELRLSVKEWRKTCGLSAKKLQDLLKILRNHEIILLETDENKLVLDAPILLELLDEWTSRNRKKSEVTPEPLPSNSRIQTEQEPERDREQNKTHPAPLNLRLKLVPVLERHGIPPDSERGRRLIRYTEQKRPKNPGGYLERILQVRSRFDPGQDEGAFEQSGSGPIAIGDVMKRLGYTSEG